VPTSDRHRDFQIECLKNPEHAGAYIEAILEEEGPEPRCQSLVIYDSLSTGFCNSNFTGLIGTCGIHLKAKCYGKSKQ